MKRESSAVGQCTKRLLLPNASRPNQIVFDFIWKFKWIGIRKMNLQQTAKITIIKITCLPVYQSPWTFDCGKELQN
jgi:hypothetical protein